tara:strand:+ start:1367 stop:1717 length:351 start_codon:yes stop_codon:yes gene_type:complete
MATFASSFGSKERKVKQACVARHFTHRSLNRGGTVATFEAGENAFVRVYLDGDTSSVITIQNGRMAGEPTTIQGDACGERAKAQARVLAKTLASSERRQDPRSAVMRMVDMLKADL